MVYYTQYEKIKQNPIDFSCVVDELGELCLRLGHSAMREHDEPAGAEHACFQDCLRSPVLPFVSLPVHHQGAGK